MCGSATSGSSGDRNKRHPGCLLGVTPVVGSSSAVGDHRGVKPAARWFEEEGLRKQERGLSSSTTKCVAGVRIVWSACWVRGGRVGWGHVYGLYDGRVGDER